MSRFFKKCQMKREEVYVEVCTFKLLVNCRCNRIAPSNIYISAQTYTLNRSGRRRRKNINFWVLRWEGGGNAPISTELMWKTFLINSPTCSNKLLPPVRSGCCHFFFFFKEKGKKIPKNKTAPQLSFDWSYHRAVISDCSGPSLSRIRV